MPCFELWLLLHFEDVQHAYHRDDIYKKLCVHLPSYSKGMKGTYAETKDHLSKAIERAKKLRAKNDPMGGVEPCTEAYLLIEALQKVSLS